MRTVIVAMLALIALVLPAATQSVGSRDNPVPMGTSADLMDNNWQITVLSVIPNATDETLYGSNPGLKYQRDPEREFFLAKIQAKYVGPGSSYFDSDRLGAVGSTSVGYAALGTGNLIQDYIPINEVFTGGVITGFVAWELPPADANHLVMYDRRTLEIDSRTYMALF